MKISFRENNLKKLCHFFGFLNFYYRSDFRKNYYKHSKKNWLQAFEGMNL